MAATSLDDRKWDFIRASINFPLYQPLNGKVRWAFSSSSNLYSDLQRIVPSISRKTKPFYSLWPEKHSSGALSVQRIPSVCPHTEYTVGLISSKWVELATHAFFASPQNLPDLAHTVHTNFDSLDAWRILLPPCIILDLLVTIPNCALVTINSAYEFHHDERLDLVDPSCQCSNSSHAREHHMDRRMERGYENQMKDEA